MRLLPASIAKDLGDMSLTGLRASLASLAFFSWGFLQDCKAAATLRAC